MRTNQWLPKILKIKAMGHRMVYVQSLKDGIRNVGGLHTHPSEPSHRARFSRKRKQAPSEEGALEPQSFSVARLEKNISRLAYGQAIISAASQHCGLSDPAFV